MTADPVTLAAQYGLAGFMALIMGWVLYRVGLRLIAAIDRLVASVGDLAKSLSAKIDEHTRVDIEYHNEVQQDLAGMRSRIDTALELTPIEGRRSKMKSNPRGIPIGQYGPMRPKPRDDDE